MTRPSSIVVLSWALVGLPQVAGASQVPVLSTPPADSTPDQEVLVTDLRKKYAWQSIYLTYGSLAEIHNLSLDQHPVMGLVGAAAKPAEGSQALALLAGVLDAQPSKKASETLAFIQIDLQELRAGCIRSVENHGALTQLPWSSSQVIEVASWADRFLNHRRSVQALAEQFRLGNVPVPEGWLELNLAKTHPLTPSSSVEELREAYRKLLEVRPSELETLASTNPATFAQVQEFKTDFDMAREYGSLTATSSRPGVFHPFVPTAYDQDIIWADGFFVRWPGGVSIETPKPTDDPKP